MLACVIIVVLLLFLCCVSTGIIFFCRRFELETNRHFLVRCLHTPQFGNCHDDDDDKKKTKNNNKKYYQHHLNDNRNIGDQKHKYA